MPPPLNSCRLKIERAKEHRDSLNKYIADVFAIEQNKPRVSIRFEPENGDYVHYISYMPELEGFLDRCALMLGDAVHNLISGLDRLAFQLALLNTGGNLQWPSRVQFPICDTSELFANAKIRWLREIAPEHIAVIEQFQGYHRIDERHAIGPYFHPLAKLRDLASMDKHRLPIQVTIPTNAMEGFTSPEAFVGLISGVIGRGIGVGTYEPRAAVLGAEVVRTKFPGPGSQVKMEMAGYISPNVAVDGEYRVVGLIDKIAAVVVNVIREFEPSFQED